MVKRKLDAPDRPKTIEEPDFSPPTITCLVCNCSSPVASSITISGRTLCSSCNSRLEKRKQENASPPPEKHSPTSLTREDNSKVDPHPAKAQSEPALSPRLARQQHEHKSLETRDPYSIRPKARALVLAPDQLLKALKVASNIEA